MYDRQLRRTANYVGHESPAGIPFPETYQLVCKQSQIKRMHHVIVTMDLIKRIFYTKVTAAPSKRYSFAIRDAVIVKDWLFFFKRKLIRVTCAKAREYVTEGKQKDCDL